MSETPEEQHIRLHVQDQFFKAGYAKATRDAHDAIVKLIGETSITGNEVAALVYATARMRGIDIDESES
jgi:hypothetical protein